MKLGRDENEKSNSVIKKLKNNLNKPHNQPERFNSAFKKRPFTTLKQKNLIFENNPYYTKNNFFIPKLEKTYFNSKYSTQNLYQNKHSFIWGRNKSKKNSKNIKYYEKEELVDKLMKLKKAFNKLNSQNTEQKIRIYKQKKELKKQNQILNEVNIKYFFEKFFQKKDEDSLDNIDSGMKSISNDNKIQISKSFPKNKSKSIEEIKIIKNINKNIPNNKSFESPDNLGHLSSFNIRELYKKMVLQNERKDQELVILKERMEHIRISNEALLSNMKLKYKQLMDDYDKKKEEIAKLKINIKCTKYNEIMKEKEIYENEMISMKSKFNKAMEAQEKYKILLRQKKMLLDEMNIKDIKINYLENKLKLNTKNYGISIENLKNELNKKERIIQRLENDKKKLIVKVNSSNDDLTISKPKKQLKLFIIQSQFNSFMITSNLNKKEEKGENKDNIQKEKTSEEKDNDLIYKTQDSYVNHNMNFSNNIKGRNGNQSFSDNDNKKSVYSASCKNMHLKKEESNNNDNMDNIKKEIKENKASKIIKQDDINEKINSNLDLYQLYIELSKRNINIETFLNEIFNKLNNDKSIFDNKKIFFDSIVKYFNISNETSSSKIIENISNKEFIENKTLEDIKKHQIELINEFSNKNYNRKEKEEEAIKKIKEINEITFKNIIIKYDDSDSGLVYFNQMISIIKDLNLEEYMEEILLMTKDSIVFNLMDYNIILDYVNKKKDVAKEKENINEDNDSYDDFENKESKILGDNEENQNKELNKGKEQNKNNESTSTKKYEDEFVSKSLEKKSNSNEINNESNKIDSIEKVLKNLAHIIVIEGSTPNIYIGSLKETIKDNINNNINAINSNKLFKFMEEKNIQMNEKEKEEIIKKYKVINEERNDEEYINFDKFSEKLFEYMKNDDGISNDEDFLKN